MSFSRNIEDDGMNILYVATTGGFMPFFKSIIRELLDQGNSVDIAVNTDIDNLPSYYQEWGCGFYKLSCSRSPLNRGNLRCIREIKEIVNRKHYDIVHCHTPIVSACTRIACNKAREKGTKVIYTAHGFHFYKGAPLINWLIYFSIEKICSEWTDLLITINKEDYDRAKRLLSAKNVEYIPGVGIDTAKFENTICNNASKRAEIGIPQNACFILSVGELNENKNHKVVIEALGAIKDKNIHYAIAGKGSYGKELLEYANSLGIGDNCHLLGYRSDIPELYKVADVYVLPSIREGLNVSVMEAMASGLPCIVSRIRGNIDMVDEGKGGLYFNPKSAQELTMAIRNLNTIENCGLYNVSKAKQFDSRIINQKVLNIYDHLLDRMT